MNNVITAARALLAKIKQEEAAADLLPDNGYGFPDLGNEVEALKKSLLEEDYVNTPSPDAMSLLKNRVKNTIAVMLFNANGDVIMQGSRTSTDPSGDWMKMDRFLDLEQAYRLRSVEIKPFKIGALWVTSQAHQPLFLDRDMTSDTGMRRMLQHVINRCEAGGLVATIDLVPEKGVHRIGGYQMVGNVRPCAAEIRRKMAEPCIIVKSPQQDHLFNESFVSLVGERFDMDKLCSMMNRLRTEEDKCNHYFSVVPAETYQLKHEADDVQEVAKRQAEEIEQQDVYDPLEDHGYHNPSDYR